MIILNKPYVSEFLIETIKKNSFNVLENEISRKYFSPDKLISTNCATVKYNNQNELFYTNSENSIDWIKQNLSSSELNKMIELSKDKVKFRNAIKTIFPNYFFKEVSLKNIEEVKIETLKFPLILKPTVGFLSFGVYPIQNKEEWFETILKLKNDINKFKDIFPTSVVDTTSFIIEEMIEGDEYAIDAYFDENNEATILNIFQHPFFDGKDVSDRAYYTSKAIIQKYLNPFKKLLDNIGQIGNYKNFPFHLELRVNENEIMPIEINPMRFCGWCITDIAYFSWGINPYEALFNKLKPNWDEILKNKDECYYYFTIADIPNEIKNIDIKSIDYDSYLKNISNLLDVRKIDYKNNPIFAIVFAKTNSIDEIKNILKLDMKKYILS